MKRLFPIIALVLLVACRHEEPVIKPVSTQIEGAAFDGGFYLLNEGNMGSNKCTLDWFDGTESTYYKNIFAYRNPMVSMELGDVGNDLKIHDGRLFAVINCSNLVEVMSASSATHITQIPIPNCRYITFSGDYAYVSSYAGEMLSGPSDRLGYVAKIDLRSYEVVGRCEVGYQPEEMVISGGLLYVANSGGYNAPDYDNRISVISLDTFTLARHIEVAPNLHRMELAPDGTILVSSRGNYADLPSDIYAIRGTSCTRLDIRCNDLCIHGNDAYAYGYNGKNPVYTHIDLTSFEAAELPLTGPRTPYGIEINPVNGDILIMDATDYVTPGKLRCYSTSGLLKWEVTTGDIPSRIAFLEINF